MKSLRKYIDKQKPHFQKGGRFEKLGSTFGAFETFLFTPNHTSKSGSHIHDTIDLKRTMIVVVLALVPALLFGCWNIGYQNGLALALKFDCQLFSDSETSSLILYRMLWVWE